MDPRHEQATVAVEDRHWWYVGRRRILSRVVGSLELPPHAAILDAGCGSGRNLEWLAHHGEVTGLELSPDSLALAGERGVGTVAAGSVEEIPLEDDSFDLATSFDVIEHLDDARGLRELRRVVKPGGLLLVSVPAYPWLWGEHDVVNHHHRRYTARTLLTAARGAGWTPRFTSHFNALLLAPTVAYRVLAGIRRSPDDAEPSRSEFDITPAWLDPVLELPLRAEAAVIARRRRIPFGLSLLGLFERPL